MKVGTVTDQLSDALTDNALAVNLNHFRLLRVVGKGAFGKVRIVERKDSGLTFALKYIRKDEGEESSESMRSTISDRDDSGPIRECTKHNTRTTNVGASQSSLSV